MSVWRQRFLGGAALLLALLTLSFSWRTLSPKSKIKPSTTELRDMQPSTTQMNKTKPSTTELRDMQFSTTQLGMLSILSQQLGTISNVTFTSQKTPPEQTVVTASRFQLDLPALPENLRSYCRCAQQGGHGPPGGTTGFAEEEMESLLSEMRENLKIYLYPIKHHCKDRIHQKGYSLERVIYELLSVSRLRLKEPGEANLFYIPTFVACWRVQWGKKYLPAIAHAQARLQAMLSEVATNFPFFTRYEGHRHFWVSTHDMGKSAISLRTNVSNQLSARLVINGSCMVNTADDSEHWKQSISSGHSCSSALTYGTFATNTL